MKKKVLLSSIATIALCLCLIAGSTFALFTSESKVNVAATAGKVSVVATVGDLTLYSMDIVQTAVDANGKQLFENGGTAVYDEANGKITLDRVTPGDKIEFAITATNSSDITIQYRITWKVEGELAPALVATVDGAPIVNGSTGWAEWTTADATTKVFSVAVELPAEVGNEYQEKTADISFIVEAVQGNAETFNDTNVGKTVSTQVNAVTGKPETTEDTVISANGFSAEIPAGTILNTGATTTTLSVTKADASTGSIDFEAIGAETVGLNISVPEVAADNTTPITITLDNVLDAGLTGVMLYHKGVPMTPVAIVADVDADGEFFYDAGTGSITLATANFSNFTAVVLNSKEVAVSTESDLINAINKGNNVVLTSDITLTKTLLIKKNVVIDLNGNTLAANISSDHMLQSSSDTDPTVIITSTKSGAKINAGDKSVILGYGSTFISNVEINIGTVKSSGLTPFKVYGDLTLGEGTVVNVDYLGTTLISNNGTIAIVIDGAEINVGTFRVNGGAMISLTKGTTLALNDTEINVGLDTTYTSYFISKAENAKIEGCTFNVKDAAGASYGVELKPDENVGARYVWVN